MKENIFKAVLFDLDGTLLDTLEDLANSMNVILKNHGMNTFSVEDYKEFLGFGLEGLIRCVIPDDKVSDELVDEFLACMRDEYGKRYTYLPSRGLATKTKPGNRQITLPDGCLQGENLWLWWRGPEFSKPEHDRNI